MTQADLPARLLAMFVDELGELVGQANESLLALERAPGDAEQLRTLFRIMHTLKGAARSAGVAAVEEHCHRLEAMLASARDASRPLTTDEIEMLFGGVDALSSAGAMLRRGESVATIATARAAGRAGRGGLPPAEIEHVADTSPVVKQGSAAAGAPATRATPALADAPSPVRAPPVATAPQQPQPHALEASLRVGPERVDELFGISNRLLMFAAQSETSPAIVGQLEASVTRASAAWRRLRREAESMSASMGTGASQAARDLATLDDATELLRRESTRLLSETTRNAREARRIAEDMSRGVRELRMRPFADALTDLPRLARDVAAAAGKLVRVETSGGTLQADRVVLAQLREALMHLVRNAVDHGLEKPDVRRAAGKPEEGTICVDARLVGDRIVVTVADDGAGLDVASVRRRLQARGENVPDDDRAVIRRLFMGGISTRAEATAISGRGVGLDVVRAVADRIRGSVDVTWKPGRGTTFTLEAPLTLATARAVLARVGQAHVAIPATFVERLMRVAPEDLRTVEGRLAVQTGDEPAVIASLAAVLGPPLVDRAPEGLLSFAVVRVGTLRVALRVDALVEEIEVVVRPIRAHGQVPVPHVSGAAMLASGTIALVLNVTSAVAAALGLPFASTHLPAREAAPTVRRRVLVVDDSITTRTLEASVIEAAGYDVIVAVDGADALRLLQEKGADLVVSDVEMPRMDGIQLCESIRALSRFRETPVILVTALEKPEHKARGLEAGADAYLGKSTFDQEALLTTIRDLLS